MLIKDYLDNIIRLIFGKMETNLGYMRVHPSALVSRIKKKKAFSRGWIPNSFSKYSHSANPLSCRKYTDFFDFHKLLYSKFGKVGGAVYLSLNLNDTPIMKKIIPFIVLCITCVVIGTSAQVASNESPQNYVRQTCGYCAGTGAVCVGYNYYGYPVYQPCANCGGTGIVLVPTQSPSFQGNKKVKVTDAPCNHRGCRCNAYIGYQTPSGTYTGKCQNSDGWGHTCNHSPEEHGLN